MSKQFPYKTNIDRVITDAEGNPISSGNPLPVSIEGGNGGSGTQETLDEIDMRLEKIEKAFDNGVGNMQLTGSIVENIVYDKVDYEDIKDYKYGYLSIGKNGFFNQQNNPDEVIDISRYRKILFYFKNDSDAEITFTHGSGSGICLSWLSVNEFSQKERAARHLGNYGKRIQNLDPIPVDSEVLLECDDVPEFKNNGYLSFGVFMGDITNATEGSYTCAVTGVK